MKPIAQAFLVSALAAFAGGAAAEVAVNGIPVSAGGGNDWSYAEPVVSFAGAGPFVVSGTDLSGRTVLRAGADCEVVASNLVLDASATGVRPHTDGLALVGSAATDGAGTTVIDAGVGLYVSPYPTSLLLPDDPAAAYGYAFVWADVWQRSNVAWTPAGTNSAALAWTGERFVAARFRGGFMVSEDGTAWREAAWDGHPVNLRAVAQGGADGGTLAAASTQGLWISRDGGLSWSQSTNLYSYAVVWSAGRFVAVGKAADDPVVHWSDDEGATWRSRAFPGLGLHGALGFVVAGGGGRFLAGGDDGFLAFHFKNGELVHDGTKTLGSRIFATAAGGGVYVTCFMANTGLRVSTNGVDWVRADKQDGTFCSIVYRNGAFFAESVDSSWSYSAGLWTSADGAHWTRVADEAAESGVAAIDCGSHAVSLSLAGEGNFVAGGFLAPAVRVASGGSVDVAAAPGAKTALLNAVGGRYAAAIGGGLGEDAGSFTQRNGTVLAAGGQGAPDIGPGAGGAAGGPVTILGGSLRPTGDWIVPAPSNGVEAVRSVVVDGLAPGAAVELANLPEGYDTDGIVADADGCVWLWLPPAEKSFRFIAGGALRRVAAGGASGFVETLPPPTVEDVSFAPATSGALQVTLRVSSPVEDTALAPAYATDLSALSSGGGEALAPSVKKIAEDEYELTFSLPADADSGFFVIRAK